jgi:hypothetical protein
MEIQLNKLINIMEKAESKTAIKKKVSQVIGARINYEAYNKLQVKCIASGTPISRILQTAISQYLTN